MPIGQMGGGRGLGQATGSINIDTSSVDRAAVTVKRVSRDIEQSMGGIGRQNIGQKIASQFQVAGRNLQKFSKQINQLRGEIAAVGLAGAALSAIGINTAAGIQEARIQLKGMVGNEQAAVKLMEDLRKQASAAGVPFSDILGASRLLLPTLQGNTQELEKWLPLARRVAVLNQREGLTGAGFAINEALGSGGTDLVSLTERFNISRSQLREELARNGGDFAAALDVVLTKMGITLETADEMGTTFNASLRAAKDAAAQLLAAGFQPLLEAITPIIRATADWLNQLRQSNPEIAKVGAGIALIAAVGAPTLLFLGQMVESITKIQKAIAAINAAKLAQLGGIAKGALAGTLAVAGGVGVGIGVTRAIGRATGNEDLANANISQLWQQIRQILFVVVAGLSEVVVQIGNLMITATQRFNQGIAGMLQGMSNFVQFLSNVLPEQLGGGQLGNVAGALSKFAEDLNRVSNENAEAARGRLETGQENFLKGALDFLGLGQTSGAGGPGSGANIDAGAAAEDERLQRLEDFNKQIQKIEENRLKQTADATEQYAKQRADTIEQYNRQAVREEEDFQRGRRRQEQQFLRDVDRINKERIEREAEWATELNDRIAEIQSSTFERIAEIRETGNERIADIEEDYREDRERREREHRNNLLTAASRLDATAIAEEQRRFKEQNQSAEEQFEERVEKERESLRERIKQEEEAQRERIEQEKRGHEERLLEARQADTKRIQDIRESLNEQQRIEDEDRAIRLARSKEDHALQLQAQAEAHRLRLEQIREQAEEERKLLLEQFEDIMDLITERGLGGSTTGTSTQEPQSLRAYRAGRDNSEFERWWQEFIARQQSFAGGGTVDYTGLAMVHGSRSRPETMLDSGTTAALRSMLGGGFNQAGLLNAVAGGNRSMTFNLSNGAIQVNAAPGQSAGDIGAAVRMELENLFESMAN